MKRGCKSSMAADPVVLAALTATDRCPSCGQPIRGYPVNCERASTHGWWVSGQ